MSFDEAATRVAARIREQGRGFLTVRREELREAFDIGKFTEKQAEGVCEALERSGVIVFPHPFAGQPTMRLYEIAHPLGKVAEAMLLPAEVPETSLRHAAQMFAREHAGRDLRSDDLPWLGAFDLWLQVVLGRPPEAWEDLKDERHPSQLARELAHALGLPHGITEHVATTRIAAAVCALRPRSRRWTAAELMTSQITEDAAAAFVATLRAANMTLRGEHDVVLAQAARLLLGREELPTDPVELGLLGLRYRREDSTGVTQ